MDGLKEYVYLSKTSNTKLTLSFDLIQEEQIITDEVSFIDSLHEKNSIFNVRESHRLEWKEIIGLRQNQIDGNDIL